MAPPPARLPSYGSQLGLSSNSASMPAPMPMGMPMGIGMGFGHPGGSNISSVGSGSGSVRPSASTSNFSDFSGAAPPGSMQGYGGGIGIANPFSMSAKMPAAYASAMPTPGTGTGGPPAGVNLWQPAPNPAAAVFNPSEARYPDDTGAAPADSVPAPAAAGGFNPHAYQGHNDYQQL
jgi:hypothetical protein